MSNNHPRTSFEGGSALTGAPDFADPFNHMKSTKASESHMPDGFTKGDLEITEMQDST